MTIPESKTCTKCGETKPLSEYHKHAQCADGHRPDCKECHRAACKARRDADLNSVREGDKDRYYNQPGRADSVRAAATRRYHRVRDTKEHAQYKRDLARRMAEKHPEKMHARSVFRHALARGDLTREPCLFCGYPDTQGHHHDYSKPLEVTWLCLRHHGLVHRNVDQPG